MTTRNTELYCHDCGNGFVAELDMDINGNHEIKCPHCEHIHYRVVENGRVTGQRYRSSMGVVQVNTWTLNSTDSGTASNSTFLNQSWNDSISGSYAIRT